MAIREGRLDQHAALDAAVTSSGLLIRGSVSVRNDHGARDRKHGPDPATEQVCIRFVAVDQIRERPLEET